ncbi:MAG: serine protease [Lysobacterales bacterium]
MVRFQPTPWFFLFALLLALPATTGAREGQTPKSFGLTLPSAQPYRLPGLDPALEKAAADRDAKRGVAVRFARPTDLNISPTTHGQWSVVDGGQLWRMGFAAEGATDLNFGFQQFQLPVGATLYFISNTKAMPNYFDGPYTDDDNADHGQFWSPPMPGDTVTVELFIPTGATPTLQLELIRVSRGFRDVFNVFGGPGLSKQGACNNDVVCPEGDLWRDEIRSVAAYTRSGIDTCTGTMVMDAEGSFTPYFLTAFHCGINPSNAASVVTLWNYESPTCGQLSGGSRMESVSGAVFRASDRQTDMALLELSSTPPTSFNVHWAGWDRSDTIPQGSVGIHHPRVDEKAISFNTDALSYASNCIIADNTNTHWTVDNWEDGTTEPGSSGSALFHPDNKGVIGFLSGGAASCSNISFDCYGRFAAAWRSGNTDAERLQPWLDPADNGPLVISGGDVEIPALFQDGFERP